MRQPSPTATAVCSQHDPIFAAQIFEQAGRSADAPAFVWALELAAGIVCMGVADSAISETAREMLDACLDGAAETGQRLLRGIYNLGHLASGTAAIGELLDCWTVPLQQRDAAWIRETLAAHTTAVLLFGDLKALRRGDQSRRRQPTVRRTLLADNVVPFPTPPGCPADPACAPNGEA
ncbi:MAG: hypothetical protein INR70_00485 [Parafilimonas terrae]|nr:hypothetical protein [Parafilimonas terrae]